MILNDIAGAAAKTVSDVASKVPVGNKEPKTIEEKAEEAVKAQIKAEKKAAKAAAAALKQQAKKNMKAIEVNEKRAAKAAAAAEKKAEKIAEKAAKKASKNIDAAQKAITSTGIKLPFSLPWIKKAAEKGAQEDERVKLTKEQKAEAKAAAKAAKAEAKTAKAEAKADQKAAKAEAKAAKADAKAEAKVAKAAKAAVASDQNNASTDEATEIMTARLFFTAAFPTIQVLLDENPKLKAKYAKIDKTVQFGAKNNGELLCCSIALKEGTITVEEGPAESPDLTLTFASVKAMNDLLKGGAAVPAIKGNFKLLADFLPLLMGLKVMTKPNNKLKDDAEKLLKVKMSLYMITRALSKYNKLGDPSMVEFCTRQPERIYQFSVDDAGKKNIIACYLRIAEGKSKSGHGVYARRSPFVLFHFLSIDGALAVLGKECEFVEGVEKGFVETIGSPEYACYLNDYMAIIQGMMM